jgi:ribose transport system permease protein
VKVPRIITSRVSAGFLARILILIAMIVITASLQRNFFAWRALVRTTNAFTPLILLTLGQAVVIIAGGLDLSIGTSVSLLTVILTSVMRAGEPVTGVTAIVIALLAALAMGAVNGIGVGYFRIPAVIVTFATSYIWLGIALFIRPTPGGEVVAWFNVFYRLRSVPGLPPWLIALGETIPPAVVLIAAGAFFWVLIARTPLGTYLYAAGSDADRTFQSGIDPARVQIKAYLINAIFIFLVALFFVGQNGTGDARMGDPLTLRSVAAAVVGGIVLTGGQGSLGSAFVGALIFSFVGQIIFFANIPSAFQTLVSGMVIIVALASSHVLSMRSTRKTRMETI